ncbi:MAG TPA: DUF885 domain-containing protein, partial [Candidatus Xenobia bacterium]
MPVTANVFTLSDALVNELVELQPVTATMVGIPGHDDEWDDYSLEGCDRLEALLRATSERLRGLPAPSAAWETLARDVMEEFLHKELDVFRHQDHLLALNSIESPFQNIRQVFDVMDKSTPAGWEHMATRLEKMEQATWSYQARLESARRVGHVVARRQVQTAIEQGRVNAGPRSSFNDLVTACPPAQRGRMEKAAAHACKSYQELGDYLERVYLPHAVAEDAVGRERYERSAGRFLGARLDADEAYRWGWDEVHRIEAEMTRLAKLIDADKSLSQVIAVLREDPAHASPSQSAFIEVMLARQNQAMSDLSGTHFDIPDQIRQVTVQMAPPGGPLGAYYIPPTEDFSRAGSIWYSVGDHEHVPLFDQISTAYHEGFPGHHLQCGIQVALADKLSRLHRLFVWYPGYGEGWALYTERLMHELGYFEKPEYELGMWACQLMRACRVVVDIGCHLKLPIPPGESFHPGEVWGYDLAVAFLHERGGLALDRSVSEVVRYLGWPGQAICYKLGERAILALRDELKQRPGFNLKD